MSATLWKILGIVAGLAIISGGAVYELHRHDAKVVSTYANQQAAVAASQVVANHDAVDTISASEAQGLRDIASAAKESYSEVKKRNDALVASNADLAGRLQHYLQSGASKQPARVSEAAAPASGADAAGATPLPVGLQQFAGWLTSQFYLADRDTVTITGLQQYATQAQQVCNGQLPGVPPTGD